MQRRGFIAGLGSTLIWPRLAEARQSNMSTIGFLSGATEPGNQNLIAAFPRGLGEQGYTEGRNVEIM
jgi:putative tryptophan/tyrosine transport system substrate-binding protein